jgi:hypothetical protein
LTPSTAPTSDHFPVPGGVEFWPVEWQLNVRPIEVEQTLRLLARSLADLSPSPSVAFVLQAGGGEPAAAWLAVRSEYPAERDLVRSLCATLIPWLGFAADGAVDRLPDIEPEVAVAFRARNRLRMPEPLPVQSRLAAALDESAGRWQLTITTGLLLEPEGDEQPTIDIGMSLVGTGPEASLAGPLLSADCSDGEVETVVTPIVAQSGGSGNLRALAAAGAAPPAGPVAEAVAGRVLSVPFRVAGAWPRVAVRPSPPTSLRELTGRIVPPHLLVMGGTGLGKTSALHAWAVDAAEAGESVVCVVCPHGDLAARVAADLEDRGLPAAAIDFSAPDPVAWNLTRPVDGMEPGRLAGKLAALLRTLWPSMPDEYFGPVFQRLTATVLEVMIRDPRGPWPITRFTDFFSAQTETMEDALARIGDPVLARAVREEVDPYLSARDAGSNAVWVVAKLQGLLSNPAVSRVVGAPANDVDLGPLARGTHLVVSAPMDRLGEEGSRLLCSMMLDEVFEFAKREQPSVPIELFVDEFHQLATPTVSAILAAGRKFGLHARFANQSLSQLPRTMAEIALGNVGAVATFRTSPADARKLDAMFPTIPADDLCRLPAHWVAVAAGNRDVIAALRPPAREAAGDEALRRLHERTRRGTPQPRQLALDLGRPGPLRHPAASFLEEWLEKRRRASGLPVGDGVDDAAAGTG